MYKTDKPNETTVAEPATSRIACVSLVTCLCSSSSCCVMTLSGLLMNATGAAGGGGGGGGATATGAATGGECTRFSIGAIDSVASFCARPFCCRAASSLAGSGGLGATAAVAGGESKPVGARGGAAVLVGHESGVDVRRRKCVARVKRRAAKLQRAERRE